MKLIFALLTGLLLCGCYDRKNRIKTGLEGKLMPTIKILAADSATIYSTFDINPGKPTLLFSFETWCPYCKAQTRLILSKINYLKDMNIFMCCNTNFFEFKKFYENYELRNYSSIHAGMDFNFGFNRFFQSTQVPCLAIYDPQKRLKQLLYGNTSVKVIREIAFE